MDILRVSVCVCICIYIYIFIYSFIYIYLYSFIYVIPVSYNDCLEHWNITSTEVHMQHSSTDWCSVPLTL